MQLSFQAAWYTGEGSADVSVQQRFILWSQDHNAHRLGCQPIHREAASNPAIWLDGSNQTSSKLLTV
jgi:ribonucleotide reductase beta subunit family protein with ferritin-like domain